MNKLRAIPDDSEQTPGDSRRLGTLTHGFPDDSEKPPDDSERPSTPAHGFPDDSEQTPDDSERPSSTHVSTRIYGSRPYPAVLLQRFLNALPGQ